MRYLHLPEGHISVSAFSENPEYLPVRQLVRHMAWKSCMRLAGKCSDRHFYEPDPRNDRFPDGRSETDSYAYNDCHIGDTAGHHAGQGKIDEAVTTCERDGCHQTKSNQFRHEIVIAVGENDSQSSCIGIYHFLHRLLRYC